MKAYDEGETAELGSDKPEFEQVGKILNNRAKLYLNLGRNEQALADFKRAYALWEKESGEARWNNMAFGQVSKNLGNTLLALGRPEEALPYLEQALRIFSQKLGPTKMHAAQARASLSRTYVAMGKFDEGLPLLQEAVDEHRAAYSPIHHEVATVLRMQAQALSAAGKLDEALKTALESERVSREYFLIMAASLSERQALDYAKSREHGLDVALSALAAAPEMASSAVYEQVIRSRSLVADGMAWRNQEAAQSGDPEIQALTQDLKLRRARLAELAATSSPSNSSFAATVAAAKAEFEQAEEKLAQHNGPFQKEWQERQITLQQVNEDLPPRAVLISYVRYRQYAVRRIDPKEESTESYAAFVMKRNEPPRFIALGAAKPIDGLVASLRDLMEQESEASGISSAASLQRYSKTGARLRRAIWDPVAKSLNKNTQMYLVVPDGMLQFVNVAALPAQTGGYLIEKAALIHRLTSEHDLLSGAPSPSSGLLAMGGADFGFGNSAKPWTHIPKRRFPIESAPMKLLRFPAGLRLP